MSVKFIYAPLVFVMTQPKLDIKRFISLLKDYGFAGYHFHLNSPYGRLTKAAKRFTFWTDEDRWKAQYEELAHETANAGLIQVNTIHDQYAQKSGLVGPLGTLSEKQNYESLMQPFPPTLPRSEQLKRFAHTAWYFQDSYHPSTYDLVGPGLEMERQMRFVFETWAKQRKRKAKAKFWFCLKNEEWTALSRTAVNGKYQKMGGSGGADKLKLRAKWLAEDSGLVFGKKVRFIVNHWNPIDRNRGSLIDPATGEVLVHPQNWTNVKVGTFGDMKAMWEVHSIEGPAEVKLIYKHLGAKTERVYFHTDGTPDSAKGVKETIAELRSLPVNTYYAVKAGKAGPQPVNVRKDQNILFEKTIPVCGDLIK